MKHLLHFLTTAVIAVSLVAAMCITFLPVQASLGWSALTLIGISFYHFFSNCIDTSARDNDGGSTPNQDAFSGYSGHQ